MTERKWRKINILLLVAIIGINTYTIAIPFLPTISYWWKNRDGKPPETVAVFAAKKVDKPNEPELPGNRLIIPRMDMNTEIIEGPESIPYANLKKGAWRLPFSTNPETGGNMVIAGHRFTYTESRSIFYYLDKLQVGDEIGIKWDGKLHTYRVESSRTVEAAEVSVQEPTPDDRLTLYTCTPIFNPINRLVVVAKPVEVTP